MTLEEIRALIDAPCQHRDVPRPCPYCIQVTGQALRDLLAAYDEVRAEVDRLRGLLRDICERDLLRCICPPAGGCECGHWDVCNRIEEALR